MRVASFSRPFRYPVCLAAPKLRVKQISKFSWSNQSNWFASFGNVKKQCAVKCMARSKSRDSEDFDFVKAKQQSEPNLLPELDQLNKEKMAEFLDLQLQSQVETGFSTPDYRHYEVLYLISEYNYDEVAEIIEKYKELIGSYKGRIWRLNDWGLRSLAYRIKKNDKANYVLMNVEIPADKINQLDMLLEKDEKVIRHLVTKRKTAITEDCPSPENFFSYDDEEFDEEFGDDDDDDDGGDGDDDDDESVDAKVKSS